MSALYAVARLSGKGNFGVENIQGRRDPLIFPGGLVLKGQVIVLRGLPLYFFFLLRVSARPES